MTFPSTKPADAPAPQPSPPGPSPAPVKTGEDVLHNNDENEFIDFADQPRDEHGRWTAGSDTEAPTREHVDHILKHAGVERIQESRTNEPKPGQAYRSKKSTNSQYHVTAGDKATAQKIVDTAKAHGFGARDSTGGVSDKQIFIEPKATTDKMRADGHGAFSARLDQVEAAVKGLASMVFEEQRDERGRWESDGVRAWSTPVPGTDRRWVPGTGAHLLGMHSDGMGSRGALKLVKDDARKRVGSALDEAPTKEAKVAALVDAHNNGDIELHHGEPNSTLTTPERAARHLIEWGATDPFAGRSWPYTGGVH